MELDLISAAIVKRIKNSLNDLMDLEDESRIVAINEIKKSLHRISPMKDEPVDCVLWVKADQVVANDYNPNTVAPPEMELLKISILEDGFTQPIVVFNEDGQRTVIDGFHRNRVGKEYAEINQRLLNYLPIVAINEDRSDRGDRIASTIRHNRARGKHRVSAMSDIVVELKRRNWSDEKIGNKLGMDPDEVLRLAQVSGLAEMFSNKEFSEAWEASSINEEDNLDVQEELVEPVRAVKP